MHPETWEDEDRFIDDLVFPRKKTLTDLWREECEKRIKKDRK